MCLPHVPTPRGRREKEAGRVSGGRVSPLYHGSGRVCVCACVYAYKVARVDGWQVVRVRMHAVDVLRLCGHVFNLYVWGGCVQWVDGVRGCICAANGRGGIMWHVVPGGCLYCVGGYVVIIKYKQISLCII